MIGISFGEILVVVIVSCIFFKPEEIIENITKFLKKIQDIKAKSFEILNETFQNDEIKKVKSDLEKMYKEMTISPIILDENDKIEDIEEFYNTKFDTYIDEKTTLTHEDALEITSMTNIVKAVKENKNQLNIKLKKKN